MIDLNVVIPSYSERENLEILLPRLTKVLKELKIKYEIIVVDAMNSIDDTIELSSIYDFKYINRKNDDTYGSAVRTGISHCNSKYIAIMDADGSHKPEFLPDMYKFRKADLVIASRYISGGGSFNSKSLKWMSKILNISYSFFLNIPCKDVSNSFRLYNAKYLKRLNLKCSNFDIVEEIIYKLFKYNKNFTVKEIPYFFEKRLKGKTKRNLLIFTATYILTIIRLRFFT